MAPMKTLLFFVLVSVWSTRAEPRNDYEDLVAKFSGLMGEVAALKQEIVSLKENKERLGESGVDRQINLNKFRKMPTSCADIAAVGSLNSGFHAVKAGNALKFVYCDFSSTPGSAGYETFIGSPDVKSTPVHFFAQKTNPTYGGGHNVTYESVQVNVGGAFNGVTGHFTAPKSGTYFFSFTGLVQATSAGGSFVVVFWKSGQKDHIGPAWCTSETYCNLNYQFMVSLNAGDIIYSTADADNAFMVENPSKHTSFTGMLIQEDISKVLALA